jgi:hypothetical protein
MDIMLSFIYQEIPHLQPHRTPAIPHITKKARRLLPAGFDSCFATIKTVRALPILEIPVHPW